MMLRCVLKDVNLMLFILYFCLYMLLSIASLNVNGLRGNLERKTIFHFLKQEQYDIILLQETHSNCADEKLWVCEWGGKIFFTHGDNNSRSVAILQKTRLNPKLKK